VNLRFLEGEIAELGHKVYQVGLKSVGGADRDWDRLDVCFSKRDLEVPEKAEFVTHEMILKLRSLLKEYSTFIKIIKLKRPVY